jgi:hypothetical protein
VCVSAAEWSPGLAQTRAHVQSTSSQCHTRTHLQVWSWPADTTRSVRAAATAKTSACVARVRTCVRACVGVAPQTGETARGIQ